MCVLILYVHVENCSYTFNHKEIKIAMLIPLSDTPPMLIASPDFKIIPCIVQGVEGQ